MGMNKQLCVCIKCDRELDDVQGGTPNIQPMDGLAFTTVGHYGSTIFDPMDGTYLEVAVCDKCLMEYFKQVAPHLVEVYFVNLGYGNVGEHEGLLGNVPEYRVRSEPEDDELWDDVVLVAIEEPYDAADPQPYHPEEHGKWKDDEDAAFLRELLSQAAPDESK